MFAAPTIWNLLMLMRVFTVYCINVQACLCVCVSVAVSLCMCTLAYACVCCWAWNPPATNERSFLAPNANKSCARSAMSVLLKMICFLIYLFLLRFNFVCVCVCAALPFIILIANTHWIVANECTCVLTYIHTSMNVIVYMYICMYVSVCLGHARSVMHMLKCLNNNILI